MSYLCSVLIFTFLTIITTYDVLFNSGVSGKVPYLDQFDGNMTKFILAEKESVSRKLLGSCGNKDISVSQSISEKGGIPKFMVEIVNTCVSGCPPSNIHLHCGMFASANLVNPAKFKRLSYDDCLVNAGRPLRVGQVISFTYSNSFKYPLSFNYANFC